MIPQHVQILPQQVLLMCLQKAKLFIVKAMPQVATVRGCQIEQRLDQEM
jgi:hypothetical protein